MAKRKKAKPLAKKAKADTVGKRVMFDRATWQAVELLARDQMKDLAEVTEEAFRDLLKKHGRSADLREALKLSARRTPANR
jgi:membrane carboxypeptidase/penicillin-binding protein PbpC